LLAEVRLESDARLFPRPLGEGEGDPMSKKVMLLALSSVLLALRSPAQAQQPGNVPRIGFLTQAPPAAPLIEAFRQGLREHGYVEGKTIVIEYRDAEGKPDRLPSLAADLVRLKVNGIVVGGSEATLAAKNATTVIPIIMAGGSDPVGTGLVASLARPGGNITGASGFGPESSGKRLELLKEVVPGLSRVAALAYDANPAYKLQLKEVEDAAQALKLQLQVLEVREPSDFDGAFGAAKQGRAAAVNTLTSAFLTAHRKKLVDSAEKSRLPVIYANNTFVEAGGLMSYGPSIVDNYRRAATYVDKILKGAKPADLPVEQPTKFEFIINLKAAKQIGLTIPPQVLARAEKVIK
jgi:putative ABC transport system substrate-binding protein